MGILEHRQTGCWCNRASTGRRRASNVFSFFRCGVTSSGAAILADGNPQVEVGFHALCQCLGNAGLAGDQRRPAGTQGLEAPRFSDNTRRARCGSANPFAKPVIEPAGRPEPRVRLSTLSRPHFGRACRMPVGCCPTGDRIAERVGLGAVSFIDTPRLTDVSLTDT
jgi:hypothetical protein